MRVLVACEFSGTVREAFRRRGHQAWSCDLLPAIDNSPYHIQRDVRGALTDDDGLPCWDLMIAHPPCTYLTISAEWAYGDGPYHQKIKPETLVGEARREARAQAIAFVETLWNAPIPRIAIENPVGVLSTQSQLGKPTPPRGQVIQPYKFEEDASKATCLWLKNLPPLRPTKFQPPRWVGDDLNLFGEGDTPRWGNQTDSGQNNLSPSTDRWAERSLTYKGIAEAMAEQWGNLTERKENA